GDRQRFGAPLTMIRRGALHAVLAEEAQRRGVELSWGKRLAALDHSDPSRVVARFADGSEAEADVLFGADGLRSTVRALILPQAPAPEPSGLLDFGGFARCAQLPFPAGVNAMVFGRRAFFGAFTTPAGETWWFHNGPSSGPNDPHVQLPQAEIRARLLDLHREDPTWIGEIIAATPQVLGAWPIYELPTLPRWSDGRVCLIGDAAHAMSPSAGQGASLAMEDAMVVAQCLRDLDDPVHAFRVYEQRRRARVTAIFEHARRNGSGKAVAGPVAEWFRDRLLPIFLRLGAAAQSKSYGYRIDWHTALTPG
ncbi:MAG TPA: FAD-dependent monooxygenase, partial [Polyangiales bacterium]|nr:FAD-dependent monooxygenase [Polyangiales bacterium]